MVDCDALAPCALEQVITTDNADQVKAKLIVEGANGPVTPAADDILEANDVLVLPDVLANAGGVVVSYFEWVQGLQEYFWKEDEVNARLQRDRHPRVRRDVGDDAGSQDRRCAWPPTAWRCSGSPRRRSRAGSIPRGQYSLRRAGLLPLRARPCAARALQAELGFPYEEVDITGDRGAGGALPRVAAGRRDRRRAGLRLLRRRSGATRKLAAP